MPFRPHPIPQRLKQFAQQAVATAVGNDMQGRSQRNPSLRQLLPPFTAAGHRRPQRPPDGYARERRQHIGTVIDVLIQGRPLATLPLAPHQPDRVHIQQKRRRAPLLGRLRIKQMRFPERQLEGMRLRRVLVQQIPQIRRRTMRGRDGQQHGWIITRCERPNFSSTWSPKMTVILCEAKDLCNAQEAEYLWRRHPKLLTANNLPRLWSRISPTRTTPQSQVRRPTYAPGSARIRPASFSSR